jgi:hypothetical protein
MSQPQNHFSLPSQVEAVVNYFTNDNYFHEIPMSEMTLSGFTQWEAPIFLQEDKYHTMQDLETISKLADFNDPRKVILDYWWRNDSIIAGLLTEDHRSKGALKILEFCFGEMSKEYIGATWYTRIPMPFTDWQRKILSDKLPDLHEGILMEAYEKNSSEIEPFCLTVEFVDFVRENDPDFWAFEKAKKKDRWDLVGSTSSHLHEEHPHEGDLSLLDWDAVRDVAIRFILRDELNRPPETGTIQYLEDYQLDRNPVWLENNHETPEEEWHDTWSTASQEEMALLAELDNLSWNPAQCDPSD